MHPQITGLPRFSAIQITLANQYGPETITAPQVLSVDLLPVGQTQDVFGIGPTTKYPNPDSLLMIATHGYVTGAESSIKVGEFSAIGDLTRDYQAALEADALGKRGRALPETKRHEWATRTQAVLTGLSFEAIADKKLSLVEYDPSKTLLQQLKAAPPPDLRFFADLEKTHLDWEPKAGRFWETIRDLVLTLINKPAQSSSRYYESLLAASLPYAGLRWEA